MRFITPSQTHFDIPDEWWEFAEMGMWSRNGARFYPPPMNVDFEAVPIEEIEPPVRSPGVAPFQKFKLVPILMAFRSSECALPPIKIIGPSSGAKFPYRVQNGFHRYHASVAVGFPFIPVVIINQENSAL